MEKKKKEDLDWNMYFLLLYIFPQFLIKSQFLRGKSKELM